MDDHTHDPETGAMVEIPVAVEHVAEVEIAASADVEIARISAERDITLAKIAAREVPRDLEAELAAALGELEMMKSASMPETVPQSAVEATQAPGPVVVLADSLEAPESPPQLPERASETPRREKSRDGWFGDRA